MNVVIPFTAGIAAVVVVVTMALPSSYAFSINPMIQQLSVSSRGQLQLLAHDDNNNNNDFDNDSKNNNARRSVLATMMMTAASGLLPPGALAQENEVEWNVFNGLIFNYRGGGFNGLDASTLDEPSVPFLEFGSRLQKGQVAFVQFYAPDGDVAYATFKTDDGTLETPIRIGQGYPIEQHDGYSSPAFVVRALNNYNVPYKFTVPGLEQYK